MLNGRKASAGSRDHRMHDYRSVMNRPIEVHAFGSGPKTVLIMAGVHGDETSGVEVVRSLLSDLSDMSDLADRLTHHSPVGRSLGEGGSLVTQIVIMPLANPDGYAAGTRQNANGIDINRNFPTKDFGARPRKKKFFGGKVAASEPETQAIMRVVEEFKPQIIISLHASLACVNYNGACVRIARRISQATGLPAMGDIGYPCPGSMGTYYGVEGRVPVITLELPKDGFQPSFYADALLRVLGVAIANVRATVEDDIADIAKLWERFMTEEKAAVPDADPQSALAGWTERLRKQIERRHAFTALQGQTIVGFIGAINAEAREWIPEGILYIVDIYVRPASRRTDAARMLFKALQDEAVNQGYRELWTNTHMGNRRVQTLLQRKGFLPLEGFAIPGSDDQLYYRKPLTARR